MFRFKNSLSSNALAPQPTHPNALQSTNSYCPVMLEDGLRQSWKWEGKVNDLTALTEVIFKYIFISHSIVKG